MSERAASAVEVSRLASGQSGVALTALIAPEGRDRLGVPEGLVDVVVMAIPARLAHHIQRGRERPRGSYSRKTCTTSRALPASS